METDFEGDGEMRRLPWLAALCLDEDDDEEEGDEY